MEVLAIEEIANLRFSFLVKNESQQDNLLAIEHNVSESKLLKGQKVSFVITLDEHGLMPGSYPLYFWAGTVDHFHFDVLDDLLPPLQFVSKKLSEEKTSSIFQSRSRLELLCNS
jgi:hypothetical protein